MTGQLIFHLRSLAGHGSVQGGGILARAKHLLNLTEHPGFFYQTFHAISHFPTSYFAAPFSVTDKRYLLEESAEKIYPY